MKMLTAAQELDMADGCLLMIRERLEMCGMEMDGCPPMMYDDAISNLVYRLGRRNGLRTWDQVRAEVRRPTALVHQRDLG